MARFPPATLEGTDLMLAMRHQTLPMATLLQASHLRVLGTCLLSHTPILARPPTHLQIKEEVTMMIEDTHSTLNSTLLTPIITAVDNHLPMDTRETTAALPLARILQNMLAAHKALRRPHRDNEPQSLADIAESAR